MTNEIREKALEAACQAYLPNNYDHWRMLVRAVIDAYEKALWRPIAEAKKYRTPILVKLRIPAEKINVRPDLKIWDGKQAVMHHIGPANDGFDVGWCFSAPVGAGGFPDEWIAGWMPLPAPPEAIG